LSGKAGLDPESALLAMNTRVKSGFAAQEP